jgi:hypothetical protein
MEYHRSRSSRATAGGDEKDLVISPTETIIPEMFLHQPSEVMDFADVNVTLKTIESAEDRFLSSIENAFCYMRIPVKKRNGAPAGKNE